MAPWFIAGFDWALYAIQMERTAGDLNGKRILITSGPTWAPIDAVRYIGNRSSGRMGCALATAFARAGGRVVLLAGPGGVTPDASDLGPSLQVEPFETLNDLELSLEKHLQPRRYAAVFQAVAGLDYLPETVETRKIPSNRESLTIRLVRAPKLIERIKRLDPDTCLIGFKLETGLDDRALFERADDLHRRSNADLVVANRLEEVGESGHRAYLVSWPEGLQVVRGPLDGREAIADTLVDWLAHTLPSTEEES